MSTKWKLVPLLKILKPATRSEKVNSAKEYRLLGIRLDGAGPFLRETKFGSQISANYLSRVKTGDFIYSRLFAWRGAFGIIDSSLNDCYVSNEFPIYEPLADLVDIRFLRLWFRLPPTISKVESDCSGSTPLTRNRFKEEFFLSLEIPLPSLDEQRRIVARIEELAARIEKARELRRRAAEETEAFAGMYLDAEYSMCISRFSGRPLDDVCVTVTDGDHLTPAFADSGIKFIFVGNVSSGFLHFNGCKYVDPEYYDSIKPHRQPRKGDILYSAVGATLGIPAIVNCDENFCFQRHVALIRPNPKIITVEFLWYMLRSRTLFRNAWSATTGSAQPTVPLRAIRALQIPVPPKDEQFRIVAYLDGLQSKLDALKRHQAETAAELDALLPAVLERAFRGEL